MSHKFLDSITDHRSRIYLSNVCMDIGLFGIAEGSENGMRAGLDQAKIAYQECGSFESIYADGNPVKLIRCASLTSADFRYGATWEYTGDEEIAEVCFYFIQHPTQADITSAFYLRQVVIDLVTETQPIHYRPPGRDKSVHWLDVPNRLGENYTIDHPLPEFAALSLQAQGH